MATSSTYPSPRIDSLTRSVADRLRPFQSGPALTVLLIGAGVCMGAMMALVLYVTKPLIIALPIAGLVIAMPTFVMREKRLYWLGVFLVTLQFEIQKNLNDGLAVVQNLNIDYTLWHFTFELRATDLVLAVLLFYWYVEAVAKRQQPYFPRPAWLLVGFLGFCLLSLLDTPSPYLGFVEISRQLKFLIFFLYIANNVTPANSKKTLRLVALMALAILLIQGTVTAVRFETGWLDPLTFGNTQQDEDAMLLYLSVDRGDEGAIVRGFGTLGSPGSTLRLCMMAVPFALMLCMRNPIFQNRVPFIILTAFGMGALLLTFTRSYYLTAAVQVAVAVLIGIRHRYLSRMEILLLVVLGLAGLAYASPKLYEQMTLRQDSMTVRMEQYRAALDMIVDNPILGVGLNNGTGVKERYVNVTFDEHDPDTQFYLEPTHNLYLSMASEIGLAGSMLYFAFFGIVIARAWRMSNRAEDPRLRWFANVVLIAFAGAIANSFYDPLHEDAVVNMLWLYCGMVLAFTRVTPSADAKPHNILLA